MRELFEIDTKDYDINGTTVSRPSARGIISAMVIRMAHRIRPVIDFLADAFIYFTILSFVGSIVCSFCHHLHVFYFSVKRNIAARTYHVSSRTNSADQVHGIIIDILRFGESDH